MSSGGAGAQKAAADFARRRQIRVHLFLLRRVGGRQTGSQPETDVDHRLMQGWVNRVFKFSDLKDRFSFLQTAALKFLPLHTVS